MMMMMIWSTWEEHDPMIGFAIEVAERDSTQNAADSMPTVPHDMKISCARMDFFDFFDQICTRARPRSSFL